MNTKWLSLLQSMLGLPRPSSTSVMGTTRISVVGDQHLKNQRLDRSWAVAGERAMGGAQVQPPTATPPKYFDLLKGRGGLGGKAQGAG